MSETVDEALEAHAPERLMIGGDWPASRLGAGYGRTIGVLQELSSELTPVDLNNLLEGTARRTYALQHRHNHKEVKA